MVVLSDNPNQSIYYIFGPKTYYKTGSPEVVYRYQKYTSSDYQMFSKSIAQR